MEENLIEFKKIIQKMKDDYNLTDYEIKTIAEFNKSIENGQYIPKLNKKVFNLFSKKMGIKPFQEQEKPDEFDSVIPFFRFQEDQMEHYASGVLIEINKNVYIVTASHNVENTRKIYIPISKDIVPLVGDCYFIPVDEFNKKRIDIAYIKLNHELAVKIKEEMRILNATEIDCDLNLTTKDFCIFTGYPYKKSKSRSNKIATEFYEYVGPYTNDESIYRKYDCNIKDNIIIRYNFRDTTTRFGDNLKETVSPKGISGGGIFTSNIKMKYENIEKRTKLIGIGHFYDRQNKILIGTNIGLCLKFIFKNENLKSDSLINN